MGREVRRVQMDFDWEIGKVWGGYLLPDHLHENKCPDCANGATEAYEWLKKVAYVITGLADDATEEARGRPMHPYLAPLREISYGSVRGRPGPQFGEFADGIAPEVKGGWSGRDVYRMHRALIAAAGLPDDWGLCPTCHGHALIERYEGQRAEAEAWEPTEPPKGDGWQMWETTSEGSPSSPVFASPEALADYCAEHVSVFGSVMVDSAHWLSIIRGDDFAHIEIAPGVVVM